MKKISILTVAYNEQDCINELISRLKTVMGVEKEYSWEVIVVDNGSTDETWNLITSTTKSDSRFIGIKLSRNFQMDGGLLAGLAQVSGDACVLMAADLQDPPEVIPSFLRLWEDGAQNVYAEIRTRRHSNLLRRFNSKLFYIIASRLSRGVIRKNASDFRLVDKKVYRVVREMPERNRFLRGLFSWVGFKTESIVIDRPPRFAGNSNADTAKVIALAIRGILAHSYIPIRAISLFALLMSFFSFFSFGGLLIAWIINGVPFAGFGSLATLNLLSFGILSLMIGIIGEYIALVYEETKGRPNFIISDVSRNN